MRRMLWGLAALLASCSGQQVVVYLAPEAQGLAAVLPAVLPSAEKGTDLHFEVIQGTWPAGRKDALVISAFSALPGEVDTSASQPVLPPRGYQAVPGLSVGDGLPLFFDVVGVTAFATDLPSEVGDQLKAWNAPAKGWPKVSALSIAGAETDLRLASWLGAGSEPEADFKAQQTKFEAWLKSLRWVPDSWSYRRADAAMSYQGGQGKAFVETFRDYFLSNPPGFRRFFPLAVVKPGSTAVVGSSLTLRAFGSNRAEAAAHALAAVLADPDFQRQFSQKSGWMPANLAAPVLDSASSYLRKTLFSCGLISVSTVAYATEQELSRLVLTTPR